MLPIDSHVLFEIAPRVSGAKAARQNQIITEIGPILQQTLASYDIDTRLRIAHFLGQTCEESDGYCTTVEYATGEAYEGRKDLGNTHAGDGRRYKGRGLIQLTGRANYTKFGAILNVNLANDPDLAAAPKLSLAIACEFWKERGLNAFADQDDIITITTRINGPKMLGLDVRRTYTAKAKDALARLEAIQLSGSATAAQPVLHRDAKGEATGTVQATLSRLGYPIAIDQDFGPATELAVRQFQAQNGLAADGIVGPETWAKLDAAGKPTPKPAKLASR